MENIYFNFFLKKKSDEWLRRYYLQTVEDAQQTLIVTIKHSHNEYDVLTEPNIIISPQMS